MSADTVVRCLSEIDKLELPPRAFGGAVSYLAARHGSTDDTVTVDQVASHLDAAPATVGALFGWLEQLEAVSRSGESEHYRIHWPQWTRVIDTLEWLEGVDTTDDLRSLLEAEPGTVDVITGSPPGVEGIPAPSIIGQMVDMLAEAEETATIVNPFFTHDGLELLLDALVDVTARGVSLTLLTRDLDCGDGSNRSAVGHIQDEISRYGSPEKFDIFEIDTDVFDTSLHAKAIIADGDRAYVGSANLTDQSLKKAVELGLYLEGRPAREVADYIDRCSESDLFIPYS